MFVSSVVSLSFLSSAIVVCTLLLLSLSFSVCEYQYVQQGSRLQLWPCSDDEADPRQAWSMTTQEHQPILLLSTQRDGHTQTHDPSTSTSTSTYKDQLLNPIPRVAADQKSSVSSDNSLSRPWCMFPESGAGAANHLPASASTSSSSSSSSSVTHLAVDCNLGTGYYYSNGYSSGNTNQQFTLLPFNSTESASPQVLIQCVYSQSCLTPDESWRTFPSSPYFAGIPLLSTPCQYNATVPNPAVWTYNTTSKHYQHLASGLCLDADSLYDCSHPSLSSLPYCDTSLSYASRAVDLVSRMQPIEKINFLVTNTIWGKNNRLGVPELAYSECLHGVQNEGIPQEGPPSTNFPSVMALSRTWSHTLIHSAARGTSDELRARSNELSRAHGRNGDNSVSNYGRTGQGGGLLCYAPNINICRDPRWGRCQESWGEDPYLTSQLANTYIHGIQFGADPFYYQAVATAKHYVVHSWPDLIPVPRQEFDVQVLQRDLLDSYTVAFKHAIQQANLSGLMCGYSSVNGIPLCADKALLTDLAHIDWDWDGYITSDCGAIGQIYSTHKFVSSEEEAVMVALQAGVDYDCPGGDGMEYLSLHSLIQQGFLPPDGINAATTHMLTQLIKVGLLEPNISSIVYNDDTLYNLTALVLQHRSLAANTAAHSIVVLENRNQTLPFHLKMAGKRIVMLGPCSDNYCCLRATYDALPDTVTTFAAGLVNASLDPNHPLFGSIIINRTACTAAPDHIWPDITCSDNTSFAESLSVAKSADIILVAIGVSLELEHESGDRLNLSLPGYQEQLLVELYSIAHSDPHSPKPLIVVLNSATQTISPFAMMFADALIHTGYLGAQGGVGLVEVLTGHTATAARLTEMWYKDVDKDVPDYLNYDYKAAPMGRGYRYSTAAPAYSFAYAATYLTEFNYIWNNTANTVIDVCDNVTIRVDITNIGSRASPHIVPLFVSPASFQPPPSSGSDSTYRYKLIAFHRIESLCGGCTETVTVVVTPGDRAMLAAELNYISVVKPDMWTIWAGGLPSNVNDRDRVEWQELYWSAVSSGNISVSTARTLLQHPGWDRACGAGIQTCISTQVQVVGEETPLTQCEQTITTRQVGTE